MGFKESLDGLDLQRTTCFLSFNNQDWEIVKLFKNKLESLDVDVWSMFGNNKENTVDSGQNYIDSIKLCASEVCLVVTFISKRSIDSNEVKNELIDIRKELIDNPTHPIIRLVPIYIDDTKPEELPSELDNNQKLFYMCSFKSDIDPTKVIYQRYNNDNLDDICKDIHEQYLCSLLENATQKIKLIRDSEKFLVLQNACIKQSCQTNTISDDIINEPTEVDRSGKNEIHVLTATNDILNYDNNTYSLMLIAGNLLGEPETEGNLKKYSPIERGTKYFYYVTSENKNTANSFREELKHFIKKDQYARRKVTGFIRKDYAFKWNLITFFYSNFQNKKIDKIIDNFIRGYSKESKELLSSVFYEPQFKKFITSTSDYDLGATVDMFRCKADFVKWLKDDKCTSTYTNQLETINDFISFVNTFFDKVKTILGADYYRNRRFKGLMEFKDRINNLLQLEKWQNGEFMSSYDSNSLFNKFFARDFSNDTQDESQEENDQEFDKYNRLESWMSFSYDNNQNSLEIPDEIVEQAYNRCYIVEVKDAFDNELTDKKLLKLCYSFVLFISEKDKTGAWYTTGINKIGNKSTGYATTYNINIESSPKEIYQGLLDAFNYLLEVNPSAKKILVAANSQLVIKNIDK